jgi:hypothetical protein
MLVILDDVTPPATALPVCEQHVRKTHNPFPSPGINQYLVLHISFLVSTPISQLYYVPLQL